MNHSRTLLNGLRAPYLAEYMGLWCIEAVRFRGMVDRVRSIDLTRHLQQRAAAPPTQGPRSYAYETSGDVAIVQAVGTLMKAESSLDASTSTAMLRNTVRRLRDDEGVAKVMFVFDSPGGSAAGTQDLADDVASLAAIKPCAAYIEDLGCSAAYWVASQCPTISTNRTGIVGSIGTYCAVYDTSKEADMSGIKVHVIATGPLKGAGVDGSVITPEQLAAWQTLVDDLNGQFLTAVSSGRSLSMERVKQLADGGVHVGQAAQVRRLVDHVESLDTAISRLSNGPAKPTATQPVRSSRQIVAEVDRRVEGLKTRYGWPHAQAVAAVFDADRQLRADYLALEPTQSTPSEPSPAPQGQKEEEMSTPTNEAKAQEFLALVEQHKSRPSGSRPGLKQNPVSAAAAARPDLYTAYRDFYASSTPEQRRLLR